MNHSTDLDALDRSILDALRSGRSFESHDKERSQFLGFDAATNRFLLKIEEFNANDVTEEILPAEVVSTARSIRCVTAVERGQVRPLSPFRLSRHPRAHALAQA